MGKTDPNRTEVDLVKVDMEECKRTRSQGPPSLLEGNKLRHWGSLPDPLQIERKHSEALRLARQVNTATNISTRPQNCVKSLFFKTF